MKTLLLSAAAAETAATAAGLSCQRSLVRYRLPPDQPSQTCRDLRGPHGERRDDSSQAWCADLRFSL